MVVAATFALLLLIIEVGGGLLSSIAPSPRLGWRLLPGVVAAAVAVMGASLLIQTLRSHPIVVAPDRGSAPVEAVVMDAPPWGTSATPVGALGKLSKKERASFDIHRARVRATVTELADAVALHPQGKLSDIAGRLMSGSAARSMSEHAPVLPKGAEGIEIIRRSGRFSVQAPRFGAAAAQLHVVMRATVQDRLVKWRNDYTFWLQRAEGKWRVISFDIDRAQR